MSSADGAAAISPLELIDPCKAADGDDPDVVLLRANDPPDSLTPLQDRARRGV